MKIESPLAPARRPRGRPRAFDREQALDSAMQVFWQKGYEAASMQDLCAAMGINAPSLYAAFGDKEALFLEAVQRYHANVRAQCNCPGVHTAREWVELLLTELATLFTNRDHPRGCLAVMALMTAPATSPRVQRVLAQEREQAHGRLRARIQQGVEDGELPPGTEVDVLTDFYGAIISGMSLQARAGASRKSLLAMVQTALRAWPPAPAKPKARSRVSSR